MADEQDHKAESIDEAAKRLDEDARGEEKPKKRSQNPLLAYNEAKPTGETYQQSDDELRSRKRRSVAIALGIVAFVVLIYLITMLKLAGNA